jgi:hypothetical protein
MIKRALIIKKEHLDKILDSNKTWEMRSSKTNIRGRIGLIESGSGLIMGEAFLLDCLNPLDEIKAMASILYHHVTDKKLLKKWKYPWVLKDAKRYKEPISYKHPQGAVIWVKL